ncbi:hypothetical protein NMG60_11001498 [Bertholletia excelsa]
MEDLQPGFRFYPTEEELVSFYLRNKLQGRRQDLERVIPVLYIYQFSPWDLPKLAGELCHGDPEQWFFFIPRQDKEARGGKPSRLTVSGYWKATGSPGYVYSSHNRVIGMKRTMVFYEGRAPAGRKTQWKMNEYRAIEEEASSSTPESTPKLRQEFSLCRVYLKSKCLRAFDRRPPAVVPPVRTTAHEACGGDWAAYLQKSPKMEIEEKPLRNLGDLTVFPPNTGEEEWSNDISWEVLYMESPKAIFWEPIF